MGDFQANFARPDADMTFYDLIATKARGKSGPLFHFDVHDDVRVGPIDSRIEKDESHPGKVVERRWYERNKHIFPASKFIDGNSMQSVFFLVVSRVYKWRQCIRMSGFSSFFLFSKT